MSAPELRPFGETSLSVSALGFGAGALGTAAVTEKEADALLGSIVDLGINLLDAARSYGLAEERIGRHLGARRAKLVLSTKGGYGVSGVDDWTSEAIRLGIDEALARMRTDWIDVFHLHSCPRAVLSREDILTALERARDSGKVRVLAYSGEGDALSWALESRRFGALQCSFNAFDQQSLDRVLVPARARGLGVIAKRPLANCPWRFSERPHGEYAETYWERMRAMDLDLARDAEGMAWVELALRFSAFAPGVSSVIVGSTRIEHVRDNARLLERGPLPHTIEERVRAAFASHGANWTGQI